VPSDEEQRGLPLEPEAPLDSVAPAEESNDVTESQPTPAQTIPNGHGRLAVVPLVARPGDSSTSGVAWDAGHDPAELSRHERDMLRRAGRRLRAKLESTS
jgi:hypothetical protein